MKNQSLFRVALGFTGLFAAASALVPALAGAMPDPAPRGAGYVSLGDSFVAAGSPMTQVDKGACGQATDNVGVLVSQRLPGVSFADWACSGAETADIAGVSERGPQVRGLSGDTEYVSLSIGGNDEGFFSDLITGCLSGSGCTAEHERAALAKLDRLGPKLDDVYAEVRDAAPNAEVVVLGYLRVLPDDASDCFISAIAGPDADRIVNNVQNRLNEVIAESADRAGFTMVNQDQNDDHTMCAPDGQRYVSLTGIGPGDEGTPIHPTLAGREYSARLIAGAFHG